MAPITNRHTGFSLLALAVTTFFRLLPGKLLVALL